MRDHFQIPHPRYLLSHSIGPLTALGNTYLQENYLGAWKTQGKNTWPKWLEIIDKFRNSLGILLNASPSNICPQPSVGTGFAAFLTSLPKTGKRRILMHSDAFPTMGFVVQSLSNNFELDLIPKQLPATNPQVWLDHITDDTCAVLLTHVYSNTGLLSDIKRLSSALKKPDIYIMADIAQSAGIIPIDLTAWNVDAVFGSCVKWLCGGPGAGFMWIKKDLIGELNPSPAGWFSHENPFEFDIRNLRYAQDALRFWGGTPNVAPYATALGGINTLQEFGIDVIRAHNQSLLTIVRPNLDLNGNGGTLCVDITDERYAKLDEYEFQFDRRGNIARLSFHIFNTDKDATLVAECLKA